MILAAETFGPLETAGPALVWLVVVTFVFVECAIILGLFLPGDSMLLTAGVVLAAHHSGAAQVWALSVGAMVAAIAGNQVGYVIGHRRGHHLIARRNGRYLNVANLRKVNALLDRYGFWAVLIARWIPWVRTLSPLVAGAARMNHTRYTIASTIGAILWAPVLLLVGFYFGEYLERVSWLLPTVLAVMAAVLVVGTVLGVRQYRIEMARPAVDVEIADVDPD
ncbi:MULTISPECIES: DedA family protein [Rhodococcus]|uniref:DedA family protein n=1 Tax=Rhodococcus indonesiensis TaxID=3055869 RepID=A0ABT7RUU7_9NOCA|nr:DedA family protein [Rhodococcus indonesiensis]MDM7490979.1 DedA family protein [Rhodococcus indonesiensis]